MILTLDLGNSTMLGCLFRDDELLASHAISIDELTEGSSLARFFKLFVERTKNKDDFVEGEPISPEVSEQCKAFITKPVGDWQDTPAYQLFGGPDIKLVLISSVRHSLDLFISKVIWDTFKVRAIFFSVPDCSLIDIPYYDKTIVGTDRICGAIIAKYSCVKGAVVVDIGTAITVDAINFPGVFLGGLILPGPRIAMEALVRGAESLKVFKFSVPETIAASSTIDCMRAGVYYGITESVRGVVPRLAESFFGVKDCEVIGCGGYAHWFEPEGVFTKVVPCSCCLALYIWARFDRAFWDCYRLKKVNSSL